MTGNTVYLVRHGQTAANVEQVWHGHTDTPLTPLGEQQAMRLGEHFHHYVSPVAAIYASPLQRAHNTARQVAARSGAPLQVVRDLQEFGVGDWEGMSFDQMGEQHDFFRRMTKEPDHRAPGGESRNEVTRRFVAAVERANAQHSQANIVVVAHGVAISLALAHWLDNDSGNWARYRLHNTAVSALNLDAGELLFFNRTDHLE